MHGSIFLPNFETNNMMGLKLGETSKLPWQGEKTFPYPLVNSPIVPEITNCEIWQCVNLLEGNIESWDLRVLVKQTHMIMSCVWQGSATVHLYITAIIVECQVIQ